MADMMAAGLAWFDAQRKANLSQSAVYTRGPYSCDLDVTIESQALKLDQNHDLRIEHADLDLVFTAADLILDSNLVEPQRGDTVVIALNGIDKKFEVRGPGNEAPWRYLPYEIMILVHLKYIGAP